jgi:hypothetical protein
VSRLPEQILRDLCRKTGHDCEAAVSRTAGLATEPSDQMMIAIWAAAGPLGAAAGYVAALTEQATGSRPGPENTADALWEMLRPLVLKTSGGSDKPFLDLLASMGR